jgi:biopolymer transport protein ExbB
MLCQHNDSALARMLAAGIKRLPRGVPAAEKAIEDAGANEALRLRRNMRFLYALGSVATLLGLIGTISGMIKAFQNAATSGPVDPHKLSTGIYEAMVNTFAGLAVAIIVTTFYYFFVGRIERLISELNDALTQFSDDFQFDKQ